MASAEAEVTYLVHYKSLHRLSGNLVETTEPTNYKPSLKVDASHLSANFLTHPPYDFS